MVEVFSLFVELFGQGMVGAEGFDQLEIKITQIQVSQSHADLFNHFTELIFQAESGLIEFEGFVGVANEDGDVV